ncbi:MAG: transposase [Candidatus Aminicenantales bacterium]
MIDFPVRTGAHGVFLERRGRIRDFGPFLEAFPLPWQGIIAPVIQTFGDRINFHPHLHFLVTDGGVDAAGAFHKVSSLNDDRIAEIFAREVLGYLVRKELLSPEWVERILSWRHTGFSVHSRVRAKTKSETERVGKYMIRPILALERLSFLEPEGKVGYRCGQDRAEQEMMDYLEFIARVTSHIPDKGQVTVRYYGLYANAHRGKVRKASVSPLVLRMAEDDLKSVPSTAWLIALSITSSWPLSQTNLPHRGLLIRKS